MTDITIVDEYIKLEKAMKKTGEYEMGSDAKYEIIDGLVKVNGEVEVRRGKKLRPGDVFTCKNHDYRIVGA